MPLASAYAHYNLGELARLRGDDGRAERQLQESFRRFDDLGDKLGIAYAQWSLGELASRQGDARRAADVPGEALQTRQEMGDQRGVIECLEGVGVMALRAGRTWRGFDCGLRVLAAGDHVVPRAAVDPRRARSGAGARPNAGMAKSPLTDCCANREIAHPGAGIDGRQPDEVG